MAGKSPAPRRRRRKKSGKYTPLIWILTGVLIAFFISYSNTVFENGGFGNILNRTNSVKLLKNNSLEKISSNFMKKNNTLDPRVNNTQQVKSQQGESRVNIFVAKQEDEAVRLVAVEVSISDQTKPLQQTLEKLLKYPSQGDLLNLIPFNTKILKISIRDRVAHIYFSQDFEFNSLGRQGYQVQIYQIVYTAAQFPTIDAVYFYTGDKALRYLGGDGTIINNPVYPFSYLPSFN